MKLFSQIFRNLLVMAVLLAATTATKTSFDLITLGMIGLIYLSTIENSIISMLRAQSAAERQCRHMQLFAEHLNLSKMQIDIGQEQAELSSQFLASNKRQLIESISLIIMGIICIVCIIVGIMKA